MSLPLIRWTDREVELEDAEVRAGLRGQVPCDALVQARERQDMKCLGSYGASIVSGALHKAKEIDTLPLLFHYNTMHNIKET